MISRVTLMKQVGPGLIRTSKNSGFRDEGLRIMGRISSRFFSVFASDSSLSIIRVTYHGNLILRWRRLAICSASVCSARGSAGIKQAPVGYRPSTTLIIDRLRTV